MSLKRAKEMSNNCASYPVSELRKAKLKLINAGWFTAANRIASYLGDRW